MQKILSNNLIIFKILLIKSIYTYFNFVYIKNQKNMKANFFLLFSYKLKFIFQLSINTSLKCKYVVIDISKNKGDHINKIFTFEN